MANGEPDYWTAGALNERFDRIERDLAGGRRRMELIEDANEAMRNLPTSLAESMLAHEQRMTDQIERLREDFREDLRDALAGIDRAAGWTKWKVAQLTAALTLLFTVLGVLIHDHII